MGGLSTFVALGLFIKLTSTIRPLQRTWATNPLCPRCGGFLRHERQGTVNRRASEAGDDRQVGGNGIRNLTGTAEEVYVSGHQDEEHKISDDVLRRVNMVSKAQKGGFRVPQGVSDTEHGVGAITGALQGFPAVQQFQAVGKTVTTAEREDFISVVVSAVAQHAGEVAKEAVSVRDRMGGRYTSVSVRQQVDSAEQIAAVLEELRNSPQVLMHW